MSTAQAVTANIAEKIQFGDIVQTSKHKGVQVKVKDYDPKKDKFGGVLITKDGKIGNARRVFKPSEVTHLWPQFNYEA